MKLETKFLIAALVAIVLAVPVALALKHRTSLLHVEKLKNTTLQNMLQSKQHEADDQRKQKDELQKANDALKQQLQSKADAKAALAVKVAAEAAVAVQPLAIPAIAVGNCSAYTGLVSQYNWPVSTALAVMGAESGCNPNSNNAHDGHIVCVGSRGLFQIGCDSTPNFASMFDPAANIAQAYALWSRRGWQPWSVCSNGRVRCI